MTLDARLPDDVAKLIAYGAPRCLVHVLYLVSGDRTSVAQDVRGEVSVGVESLGPLGDLDPVEEIGVLADVGDDAP